MGKTSKRKATLKAFDKRLYALPNRMEVLDNLDVNMRTPLSSMQLWEVEDGPVVIEAPSGESRIFLRGEWRGMDSWEAVFEGRPMSFQMLEEKWPGLVSVDEYLVLMLTKQQPRDFGADDKLTCQHCGGPMHLIRRGPHPDLGTSYERQTFLCPKCNVEVERSVDKQGQPHPEA